jgi:hypothetical protein
MFILYLDEDSQILKSAILFLYFHTIINVIHVICYIVSGHVIFIKRIEEAKYLGINLIFVLA